jgi:C-terminal processing protease CtpA/Prc
MKRSTKFLLIPILLIIVIVLSLALAFFGGYEAFNIYATHQTVQPSEFDKKFQPAELKPDLDFLIQTLESVHPNLYAYTPKSVMDIERERIVAELTFPLSRIEFYLKIAPLVAMLNEGHTRIYPPYEEYHYFIRNGGLLFPFDLDFRDGKVYVTANYSSDSLVTEGSELLSINKIRISTIVDSLLKYISSEKVSHKFETLKESLAHMLWLVYRFENQFEVEFTSKSDGQRYIRTIQGATYSQIQTQKNTKSKDTKQLYYSYHSLPKEKIGVIEFQLFTDIDRFKKFLKETFTQIRKEGITDLIIDIRENGGGYSELGDIFLSYLTDKPAVNVLNMEIKASKQIKDWYRKSLRWYVSWLPFQYLHPTWRKIWNTPEGGIAVIKSEPEKPKENRLLFTGQVYLLIGPKTFSSATGFAAIVKDYELGTLIGEETGGLATSYGDFYPFDLPNTKLWVLVSHKRIFRPSGEDDGRGVLPDYEVKQSTEDLEKGIDCVMEYTKELIKSSRSKTQNSS